MKTISKIAAIALVAFAVVGVNTASAATVAELQAMIAQLTAQIAALSGTTTTTPSAVSITTNKSSVGGMLKADIVALQNFLISKGYSIPAGATGNYGPQTTAALAAYQTAKGITPAAGYFGPKTMAAVNAESTVTTGGTTTTTGTLSGVGTLSVSDYNTDVETDIDTGSSENILGFRGEASDGDVKLTHLKVSLSHVGSNSNRLERYFDSFKVVMNGKTVATVAASDFNRDSAGEYSKTIALTDAVIKKGSSNKATFYVVAEANDTIDTSDTNDTWTVNATNFRYEDGTGAVLTESTGPDANTGVNVNKLSSSSDIKAKFSTGSANPEAQTVFVDEDTSGTLVTLNEFKIKAEGTDMSFDTAYFTASTTGSTSAQMVSEFQLVKGSSVIESTSTIPAGGSIVVRFDLDDEQTIAKDATETYKLVAKMNKNTDGQFNGSTISASASTTKFGLTDKNGDVIAVERYSGSVIGNDQTVRGNGVQLAKTSISEAKLSTGGDSAKDYPEFTFTVKATADGDDVYFSDTATSSDFSLTKGGVASNATTTVALSSVSGATKTSGMWRINDGETATLTYKVTVNPTGIATGVYKAIISNFNYDNDGTTFAKNAAFTPVDTYTSGSVTIVQ